LCWLEGSVGAVEPELLGGLRRQRDEGYLAVPERMLNGLRVNINSAEVRVARAGLRECD